MTRTAPTERKVWDDATVLIRNAERWISLLRGAIRNRPERCFPQAIAWITYLETLTVNAALDAAEAGAMAPGVPVAVALAAALATRDACPPTPD